MRILLAGQTYFREDNGQAVFTCRLARGLAAAGHTVLAIAPSGDGKTTLQKKGAVLLQQVPALSLPYNANITFAPGRIIKGAMESFAPDIVHLQDHYFISTATFNAAKKLKIPTVGSNHFLPDNVIDNLHLPTFTRNVATRLLWSHMLSKYNQLLKVTTPTETGVEILRQQNLKPPVEAISCGIDATRFCPPQINEREKGRKHFNLDPNATVFVFVGRIDHEKGLGTVLEAFAEVKNSSAILYLGGKGSYANTLKRRRDQLGLTERVFLPGFIGEDDLPLLLRSSDCFIMAGHAELQSIATLEAMASGLPVIAANARALPELVENGVNGFLFPPHDIQALAKCMNSFIDCKKKWPLWRTKSRERACQHDLRLTVEKYLSWYQSVIPS